MQFCLLMQLWFDVEERYNATRFVQTDSLDRLWFDVEERYNATNKSWDELDKGCGLM